MVKDYYPVNERSFIFMSICGRHSFLFDIAKNSINIFLFNDSLKCQFNDLHNKVLSHVLSHTEEFLPAKFLKSYDKT